MSPITTKHRLFTALATGGMLTATANNEVLFHYVNSVEREDGSNKSWNVTGRILTAENQVQTRHIRTID